MNIIETINDETFCIDAVTEYFNGKFSREEVKHLLYDFTTLDHGLEVRRGVGKLAEEWHTLQNKDVSTVEKWYSTTDFYIFDLLPWNACSMFTDKLEYIVQKLEQNGIQTLLDYGGGLGIASLYIKERLPEISVFYVDFENSHQFKFSEFLAKKVNAPTIPRFDVHHILRTDTYLRWFDAILAMDCFEHIPNLEETISILTKKTNIILNDSTFHRNEAQPQHVNAHGDLWFINLMLKYQFILEGDPRTFKRFRLDFDGKGFLPIVYDKTRPIYPT
jgi:hypothetical protein